MSFNTTTRFSRASWCNFYKMNWAGFLILSVINLFGLLCKGQICPKSSEKTVISNSTVRLSWTFLGDPSKAGLGLYFTKRTVGSEEEEIALKYRNNPIIYFSNSLPRIAIEIIPSRVTLVLTNVDERYNGKYRFHVQVVDAGGEAEAELYIAVKPNVTINCSSLIKLNEGDDFTCLCRAEGGNPPANVTWFKNGTQFGETKTENNTLTRPNVDETDNATYTCFAQSYFHPMFEDSKTVVVLVKFKPKKTAIEFTKNPAKLGTSVTMKCKSRGFPEPSYTITLNGTKTVSTEKTYTISKVGWNDTGTYNCTATNERGSDWAAVFLDVTEQGPTATSAATTAASTPKKNSGSTTSTTKKGNNGSVTTTNGGDDQGDLTAGAITAIVIIAFVLLVIGIMVFKYKEEWKKRCCECRV